MKKSIGFEPQENTKNPQILLIGLTSVGLGNMEFGNLGNYMIIEPLIARLRTEFPQSEIRTSIQLSDEFCHRFDIISLREKRFWSYGKEAAIATIKDIIRLLAWYFLRPLFGKRADFIFGNSTLLSEIYNADLVIDFSGDVFGDNASFNKFLEGCAEILFARALGKPVVMLASSPGPFTGWRKPLAKFILNRMSLITNREPLSTELLIKIGIEALLIENTACPAFLFGGKTKEEIQGNLKAEKIRSGHPVIGLILSGWNMPEPPYNRVPRQEWELTPFVKLIEFLMDQIQAQVVLISHSHRLNDEGQLIFGPDAALIKQIYEQVSIDNKAESLILLSKPYDAATTKGLVGVFDILISGRLHGAISGLSQGIPTVIIDYGHEPKAHKLRGVARLLEIEDYVCDPSNPNEMIETVSKAWLHRRDIQAKLSAKAEEIENLAAYNITVLHKFV